MVKVIDLNKITHEMIKNGTWEFKNGVFRHTLGGSIIGFDGENFYFPDYFSRKQQKEAKKKLEFVLGLNTDLEKFYSEIEDSKFAFLIKEFYGLTIPKAPDKYQALVETIAQQQVSFEFAMRTIRNLVKLAGKKLENLYIFPNPRNILNLSEEKLRETKLGYRAGYIRHLTREYLEGNLNLDLEELDEKEAIKYLTKFKGIGRWSAELFLAYGLGKNVYPAGDLPYGKWKSLLAFYILCYDRKTETVKKRGKN